MTGADFACGRSGDPTHAGTAALSPEELRGLYRGMLVIRVFEERVAELYPEQEMRCPVHFCTGQEAIPVGVCAHLEASDYLVGNHRSHGHCIAKGLSLRSLAAELYGRATGCAGGKGGSMHLVDPELGILGTTAIVGGSLPLAVGAALASFLRRESRVAVAFFGDGAVEQGTFHESLNFASLKRLPVVFVCENNFYATASPQAARQPPVLIADRASAYGIPGRRGDGNDVREVHRLAGEAVRRARNGGGPTLLEFETYRWKGHVGPEVDAGVARPAAEHAAWMGRCPVRRCRVLLEQGGALDPGQAAQIETEVRALVEDAISFAQASPFPDVAELETHVL
ncbi:MAG: thiamine pyrophosphate-dependent dehydrogenase E1 component subunit alpha [Deferrisomatales bacterium]|nr:thiamine pyrophosphate-dependent dehydrogenase E1 component subunit alpha [Deferrisomatales bacterium]